MKTLLTALILVACVPAAFASAPKASNVFTAGQLLNALNGDQSDADFAKNIIVGISLGDDNVCNADFTLGETADQGAVSLKMLIRKYPDTAEKPAGEVVKLILETNFSCSSK